MAFSKGGIWFPDSTPSLRIRNDLDRYPEAKGYMPKGPDWKKPEVKEKNEWLSVFCTQGIQKLFVVWHQRPFLGANGWQIWTTSHVEGEAQFLGNPAQRRESSGDVFGVWDTEKIFDWLIDQRLFIDLNTSKQEFLDRLRDKYESEKKDSESKAATKLEERFHEAADNAFRATNKPLHTDSPRSTAGELPKKRGPGRPPKNRTED